MRSSYSLDEYDAGMLLSSYGIPMAKTMVCMTSNELECIANEISFPVVMKVLSSDILHKTDAGAVMLGITNGQAMKPAFETILRNAKNNCPGAEIKGIIVQEMQPRGLELIFGVKYDPQFGHVILFGLGGIFVEILNSVSMRLAPLTRQDALDMISETPLAKVFRGARRTKYNEEEIITIIQSLSRLVQDHPNIIEIDMNPFIAYENGKAGCGVDAVIVCNDTNDISGDANAVI